ncbi:protein FAM222A-like [Osmerus mordax]|uniref:protein FAM222A-like n=1 Tax=Osmerus mordax TaxID=8014 RepID=UPI00350F6025
MLACVQRRQNLSSQRLVCAPKILEAPPLTIQLPPLPSQSTSRKHELASMAPSRYPSAAELDAFAQKTASSPLSIKIFPSNIRVPQHKQLNRTVNGLDTTGPRYSPYSGGYQGLLATVKASVLGPGVVKTSEGKRTKHSPEQTAVAPYNPASRHGLKAFHRPPNGPGVTAPSHLVPATSAVSGTGQTVALGPQGMLRQMGRQPHSQALPRGGGAQASPFLQAVAAVACSDSGFPLGAPAQSGLAYSGAVLPTQSADIAKAGYLDAVDYGMWQQYHQGALRMYGNSRGSSGGGATVSRSPETCLPLACSSQLSYRPHPLSTGGEGGGAERVSSSPLNCAAMHGEFSVGQYFAPPWNSLLVTPDSDCYTSQEMLPGSSMARPRDMGLSHPHPHPHPSQHPHPGLRHLPHPQAYSTDQSLGLCCGVAGSSLCHASVLSSSLQSLECLISEIHPPCIKERMLGRGYNAAGLPHLLDYPPHQHPQQLTSHIQLPVFR